MKFKFGVLVLLFVILISSSSFVFAKDQSLNVNYNFNNSTLFSSPLLDFSSVLLKVDTGVDAYCKYDLSSGVSYSDMQYNFDSSVGNLHKKNLVGLGDGIYKYYVKCVKDPYNSSEVPPELVIVIKINSLVTAQIVLSEDSPLNAGTFGITLITSKIVSQTPLLSYSYDGIVYKPVVLMGSGTVWEGYFTLDKSFGEGILSFKFSGNDLEGRGGTEITQGSVFEVDTVKPPMITEIEAVGNKDYIKLEWHYDEDFEEFNIYRSEFKNPDYIDFYKTSDDTSFVDTLVEEGKTYYYRVSPVDKAGNEGDLSKEVFSTSLISSLNGTLVNTGLSLELRSYVDNFLVEIDSKLSDLSLIEQSFASKTQKEKDLISSLGLDKDLTSARNSLNSLRKNVEGYKNLDLSREDLLKRIDSSTLKLNVIQKKIPQDLIILLESSSNSGVSEGDIEEAILEISPLISQSDLKKSVKESLKRIDESGLSISSDFYVLDVVYADGTRKKISVVRRTLNSQLERDSNSYFVENIPVDVIESVSDINVKNPDYNVVKEDTILSFGTDTKSIFYSVEKELSIEDLKSIKTSFAYIFDETPVEGSNLTGYFLLGLNHGNYLVFGGFLLLLILIFGGYFYYVHRNNFSEEYFEILKKIDEGLSFLDKGKLDFASESYSFVKKKYSDLGSREKKIVYKKVQFLHKKILIFKLEKGLEKLKKKPDKVLFLKLKKIYDSLPVKHRKRVSRVFENIQKDFEFGGKDEE